MVTASKRLVFAFWSGTVCDGWTCPPSNADSLVDASVRCGKCGTPGMGTCACWVRCSCGWWAEAGRPCRNPLHQDALCRELAEIEDPTTHSHEGLDDGCFFCTAWSESVYENHVFEHFANHYPSCLWVRARRMFELPLGRNTVRSTNGT
jgi:hypothetical protein